MKNRIKDNCTYFYNSDIELMMAGMSVLSDCADNAHFLDKERLLSLKEKYVFLFDTVKLLEKNGFFGLLEFLTDIDPTVSIKDFKSMVLSFPKNKFLQTFFFIKEPVTAVSSEDFYRLYKEHFNSYLGCLVFYNETNRIILDFFELVNDINDDFVKLSNSINNDRQTAAKLFEQRLNSSDPLEFSQELMGKTFYNRGPYKHFYFMHSLFTPNKKSIRYFGENQVFFYPLYLSSITDEDVVSSLKTIADSTRFKLLMLLRENKVLRGTDIALKLGLTSATISHHIGELRSAGLVHEEQEKNNKYYSINKNRLIEIINMLDKLLK